MENKKAGTQIAIWGGTFLVIYVLVTVLTVAVTRFVDPTPPVISQHATMGFPNAAPQMTAPSANPDPDPSSEKTCVSFCASEQTGTQVPCANKRLVACKTDGDCDVSCSAEELKFMEVACQSPEEGGWPTVRADQMTLNNGADKYCLPTRRPFVETNTADGSTRLLACRDNSDCARCTNVLPNGEQMQCEIMAADSTVDMCDDKGACETVTVAKDGQYCVPKQSGCNYDYGVARWTANEGWQCMCLYPDLFGGEHCDELVACQARDVTAWSAARQKLLLNMEAHYSADGSVGKIGDPWRPGSDVNPMQCVDVVTGEQGSCDATNVNHQPTVACQCDGMQNGTLATYTFDETNNLQCRMDGCYQNIKGGRTLPAIKASGEARSPEGSKHDKVDEFPDVPHQPATTCSCSGFGSSLWSYDGGKGVFTWTGHCEDTAIPGTRIVLRKGNEGGQMSSICDEQINTNPTGTILVPGKNDEGGDKCTPDPCAGRYSDPTYLTEQDIGTFDLTTGMCKCQLTPDETCEGENCKSTVSVALPADTCDNVVNPVCSYCMDACILPLDETCPTAKGDSCPAKRCKTNADGSKLCECGETCFWYNGECHNKIQTACDCSDFNGVEDVCVTPGDTCHVVRPQKWSGIKGCTYPSDRMQIVCFPSDRQSCGDVACLHSGCGGHHHAIFKTAEECRPT